MKHLLILTLTALLLLLPLMSPAEEAGEIETLVTLVTAPPQDHAERPPCFPDPTANYIPMPEGENLALGKPAASGAHTDVYVIGHVNDGSTVSYWESKGYPAEVLFDLQGSFPVSTVTVSLNPAAIWEPRIQEIQVLVSTDGETFTQAAAPEKYQFDPETGNRIRIDFSPVQAAFVKVIFTMNSAARTGGAQAAEIGIYSDGGVH